MDLGDGGGGPGGGFEVLEQLFDRRLQLLFDDGDRPAMIEGRDLVLEPAQLLDQSGGQQIVAGADDLAELDEGRAQLLQGHAQALPAVVLTGQLLSAFGKQPPYQPSASPEIEGVENLAESVLDQYPGDVPKSSCMSEGTRDGIPRK